ncbi:hypothetical protein ACQY0O_008288 [Thecaphora frezii]
MAYREFRGVLFDLQSSPESRRLKPELSAVLAEWTGEPLSDKMPLPMSDEASSPPPSQLKRQTAIRRDGSSSDLKTRSPRGGTGRVHPPLPRDAANAGWPSPASSSSSRFDQHVSGSRSPQSAAAMPTRPDGSRIHDGSISRNRKAKLALTMVNGPEGHAHKHSLALSGDDPRTPRPYDSHTNSPQSATSSCDSEEDKQLLTPLDGTDTIVLDGSSMATPLSHSFSRRDVPNSPEAPPAERVGMSFGVGSIGASADVGQLGLGLDGRRGMPDATPSPRPDDDIRKRDLTAPKMRPSGSGQRAPLLSRETLFQTGNVPGITPPASTIAATGIAPREVSSVVSTGLEMGLGVGLASSALINHMPGATSAISGLAEPRYMRPSGPAMNAAALQSISGVAAVTLTEREPDRMTTSASQNQRSDAPNGHVTSQAIQDSVEADLHRRRTTGGIEAKGRPDPARQIRHHRADTHDPIISHAHSQLLLQQEREKQQHQQNNYIARRSSPAINTQNLPTGYMLDMPLSAETSLDRNSSLCSSRARASISSSTYPETPSLGERALLSPDAHLHADGSNPLFQHASGARPGHGHPNKVRLQPNDQAIGGSAAQGPANAALMGLGAGGHFAPGVRAKVAEVLPRLIAGIPLTGDEGETVTIAEYGCLNTRSMQLMQPIISCFAEKAHSNQSAKAPQGASPDEGGYFGTGELQVPSTRTALGSGSQNDAPCRIHFSIVHEDSPQADFRPVSQTLNTSSDSYLDPHWQATHEPSLQNAIFQSFVSRPFASRIVPPSTVHLGISLMDLHWSHTPRNPAVSQATSAHAELTAFLTARAHEVRKGGVFLMAYIARSEEGSKAPLLERPRSTISCVDSRLSGSDLSTSSEEGSTAVDLSEPPLSPMSIPDLKKERSRSNSTPTRPIVTSPTGGASKRSSDIWTTLTDTLAPCLQRLVSCGMLKSDVARHLLTLPMHPRTPRQTQNVLRSLKHLWSVEWSCGLEESLPPADDQTPTESNLLRSEAEPLRLPHPAWKALQAGTLSRVAFAEHMIQLFKNLYEAHFRVILREKGRLSKGAVEFVLDSLWDVLQSRIDDQEPCPIAQCELEVQVVALRRL